MSLASRPTATAPPHREAAPECIDRRASGLRQTVNFDDDEKPVFEARQKYFRPEDVCAPFYSFRSDGLFVPGVTGLYYNNKAEGASSTTKYGPFYGVTVALDSQKPTVHDAVAEAAAHYLGTVSRATNNRVIYAEVVRRLEEHTEARAKHVAAARLDFLRRAAVFGTTALALTATALLL